MVVDCARFGSMDDWLSWHSLATEGFTEPEVCLIFFLLFVLMRERRKLVTRSKRLVTVLEPLERLLARDGWDLALLGASMLILKLDVVLDVTLAAIKERGQGDKPSMRFYSWAQQNVRTMDKAQCLEKGSGKHPHNL